MTEATECLAEGCAAPATPDKPWCGRHWAMLPSRLQALFYHRRRGPLAERATAECKEFLARAEFGARLL